MPLLTVVTLVYVNHFGNGFHFDDSHTVVNNPAIRSVRNIPSLFTDARTFSVLPQNRTWRPLVSTSLAVDYAIGHGLTPWAFHLSSLAPLAEVTNDHRMFLPFVGLTRAVVAALRPPPLSHRYLAPAAAVWLIALSCGTVVRNAVWHNEATLWADTIRKARTRDGHG